MARKHKKIYKDLKNQRADLVCGNLNWKGKFETDLPAGKAFLLGGYSGYPCTVEFGRYNMDGISARVVNYLKLPPDAKTPVCSSFGLCGGCSLQHMSYESQLALKKQMFLQEIDSLPDKIKEGLKIHASSCEYGYRNKVELSFRQERDGTKQLGFHESGRFQTVLDVDFCQIQMPLMQKVYPVIREWFLKSAISGYNPFTHEGSLRYLILRESRFEKTIQINFVFAKEENELFEIVEILKDPGFCVSGIFFTKDETLSDAAILDHTTIVYGREEFIEKIGDFSYAIGPKSFFQTNSWTVAILYQRIREILIEHGGVGGKLIDFYCGAGTIGIYLSDLFSEVIGIEEVSQAVECANRNKELNSLFHLQFHCQKVEKFKNFSLLLGAKTLIVDPPRMGCHPKARKEIMDLGAQYLCYVSCNPQTLIENLSDFMSGGYEILTMELVDMFPQTPHVESVVLMKKQS